jgi:hypothetical protein
MLDVTYKNPSSIRRKRKAPIIGATLRLAYSPLRRAPLVMPLLLIVIRLNFGPVRRKLVRRL